AAEICTGLVRRGADGDLTPPSQEDTEPVWARWDALSGAEQRTAWAEADEVHRRLLSEVGADVVIPYFAGPLGLGEYAGYRLSEQAVHGWDVEVVLDSGAVVQQVDLLWERLGLVAGRFHDAGVREGLGSRVVDFRGGRVEVGGGGVTFTATGSGD